MGGARKGESGAAVRGRVERLMTPQRERRGRLSDSIGGIRGERPAGTPELGGNDGVTPERAPHTAECLGNSHGSIGMWDEREREGGITGALIDPACDAVMSALKNPAKQSA